MFKIKSKQTNKIYIVYGVVPELTITWFLIFDDNTWSWVDSVHYEPYEEPTKTNEPTYVPIPYIPCAPPTNPNDNWWTKPYVTWTCDTTKTE